MNLQDLLLQEHSKKQKDRIITFVGDDVQLFAELVSFVLSNDTELAQRASWPFSYLALAHPHWMEPYQHQLLSILSKPGVHDAVKRNILRIWREYLPEEEMLGEVFDCCGLFLRNPHEAGAIRAFSIQVMGLIALRFPELKQELMLTLDDALLHATPAITSSARKIQKQLAKVKR